MSTQLKQERVHGMYYLQMILKGKCFTVFQQSKAINRDYT